MGLFILFLIAGLVLWLLLYLFYKSVMWVLEPLVEYMQDKEAQRFAIENIGKDGFEEADLEGMPGNKVNVTVKDFDRPVRLSKSILQKAQKEPQKLPNTSLWVYKNHIFSSEPRGEKLSEISREEKDLRDLEKLVPHPTSQEPQESFVSTGGHVLFPLDLITPDLKSKDKRGIIKEMVELFVRTGRVKDGIDFYKKLLYRESLGSTGIGNNIAIPYTTSDVEEDIVVGVGISREGVEFDSHDGKPVKIIFMSAHNKGKGSGPGLHLSWLARISRFFEDAGNREALIGARSKEEVYEFLKKNFAETK